jgi:asparagine synthase (glutamine-hydrolysing)
MCGIAGIIAKNGLVENEKIIHSCNLISHRGPDAQDYYNEAGVALGHTRLSILDLSDLGKQPMSCFDKYIIVFNGEVYNYIEVRNQLKQQGYNFKTETDTEVIVAAYDYWGVQCLSRFNGMWAFALYDIEKKQIFISRDRFGVKPFYYRNSELFFEFGSEIKQCLGNTISNTANKEILLNYIITGYENYSDETFFKDVKSLPASSFGIYDLSAHTFTISKYYSLNIPALKSNYKEADYISEYSNLFSDSVKLRMRSDVKVGTCLSGGIDSSMIALFSSNSTSDKSYSGIHGVSYDASNNELHYAKLVSEHLNIHFHEAQVSSADYLHALHEVAQTQEEPFSSTSIILQYFVMKKARETGNIVMLDGQGGDETLMGYERYYSSYIAEKGWSQFLKNLIYISNNSKLSLSQTFKYFIYFRSLAARKKMISNKFEFNQNKILKSFNWDLVNEHVQSYHSLKSLQISEIEKFQLPHLLRYEDRNSMRWGIETRLPFLDYRVVECSLGLPIDLKIKDGWSKIILRKIMDGKLPDEIVWRKNKIGFEAPKDIVASQFNYFEEIVKESNLLSNLFHEKVMLANVKNRELQWRLISIALWEINYNVIL